MKKYYLVLFLLCCFYFKPFAQTDLKMGINYGFYNSKIALVSDDGGAFVLFQHDLRKKSVQLANPVFGISSELTFWKRIGIGVLLQQREVKTYAPGPSLQNLFTIRELGFYTFHQFQIKRFTSQIQIGISNMQNLDYQGDAWRSSGFMEAQNGSSVNIRDYSQNISGVFMGLSSGYNISNKININLTCRYLFNDRQLSSTQINYNLLDLQNQKRANINSTGAGFFYYLGLSYKVLEQKKKKPKKKN